MLPQLHAAHPRSDQHSTATLRWMSWPVAATPETVQQIVTTLLPDGSPDIHTVAAMARLSVRTLQRRLHDQGVTFAGVVAGARLAMAQQMLVDPARKVIDVALDLGYSDPAHFTRAFVRWTGLAPRQSARTVSCQEAKSSRGWRVNRSWQVRRSGGVGTPRYGMADFMYRCIAGAIAASRAPSMDRPLPRAPRAPR
jgi:AraC-like DNA-binding protein